MSGIVTSIVVPRTCPDSSLKSPPARLTPQIVWLSDTKSNAEIRSARGQAVARRFVNSVPCGAPAGSRFVAFTLCW